jgi:HSP20 family protein
MKNEKAPEKETHTSEEKENIPVEAKAKTESAIESLSPFRFWREFDRAFDRFRRDFEELLWPSGRILERAYAMLPMTREQWPCVDIEDRGKDYRLTAELPGVKKEDVEVEVEDRAVEIKGRSSRAREEKTSLYVRKERASQEFHRRIELPEEVKSDEAEASLKDGVLELILPKKAPKPRRKISIK